MNFFNFFKRNATDPTIELQQQVLSKYGIEFVNRDPASRIYEKTIRGGGMMEDFFELSFNSPQDLDRLISVAKHMHQGNNPPFEGDECEFFCISTWAFVEPDGMAFYESQPDGSPLKLVQTVPLADFIMITQAWKAFLWEDR